MNIVVLAGGNSPEREVSLSSGRLVSQALRRRGHRVKLLDVWRGLTDEEVGDHPMLLFEGDGTEDAILAEGKGGMAAIGENVLRLCKLADVVFLALHGGVGENGQLQAMLDCLGIRYTGSGFMGSLLAMEKPLCKLVLRQGGVLTPDWYLPEAGAKASEIGERIAVEVGFPCVIKPCDGGSSIGISMVETPEELAMALQEARWKDVRVMAERRIFGREFSVAILDGQVLPAIEIIPREGFYDYDNKYLPGRTEEICPAALTAEQAKRLAECASRAFTLLGLSDYARGDFIMDENGRFWCLEFNTLPGMTPTSLLPQEVRAAGMSYEALCEKIVQLALEK